MSEKGNQAVKTVSFMMLITLLRNGYAGGGIFAGKPDSPYLF